MITISHYKETPPQWQVQSHNSGTIGSIAILNQLLQYIRNMPIKGKAVPLHAMEGLGRRGGIAPTHSRPRHLIGVSGQRHAPDALLPPGKGPPVPIVPGGWVGPRAGLDTEARGKILCPRRG
jgi:hypothetical protein